MTLLAIIAISYIVIGVVIVAIATWVTGELTVDDMVYAAAAALVWPLFGLYAVSVMARKTADTMRPWWEKNRDKVLWKRRK